MSAAAPVCPVVYGLNGRHGTATGAAEVALDDSTRDACPSQLYYPISTGVNAFSAVCLVAGREAANFGAA